MAETDSLLKRLVSTFILDFAAWLLGTAVQAAHPLPSEMPAATVAVDQVFQVTLTDGRTLLLHIEFQGRRSHAPMSWRMLEYMSRLAYTYRLALESVVLYIGRGAGVDDTGLYEVHGLAGAPVLAWGYRVIRLWQMPAEALLVMPHMAPLALVGQMHMAHPEATLTAVVTRMRQVTDIERRGHLLTALVALLPEEEMVSMVERLLEDDELLVELPYLQRIREAGREEGREEGREAGREAGREEGRIEGRREGEAEMLLRLLRLRFGPLPAEITARVASADPETLLRWSERVLSASTLEAVFTE